jgi:Type II secretory pathway, prepilin signal peptidase PulO and related peptidases
MEITYIVIFGILGAAIGSFLNVVIDRLPAGKSIAYPPSSCDACQHRLSWPDLFPVFSYLFLRGRCRYCKAKIPQRVFWVELGTGLLTALLFWRFGWEPILPVMIVYCSALIAIGMIDLKNSLIFPAIVFPVALVALVVNFFIPKLFSLHNLLFGLMGAAFGSIFLLLAFFLSKLILKKEGMGLGDVYMAAMMGFMVGFPKIIVALFCGIIIGGGTAIFLVISKKKSKKDTIPFGECLAIGTIITLLWGTQIMHWYLHLAHFE